MKRVRGEVSDKRGRKRHALKSQQRSQRRSQSPAKGMEKGRCIERRAGSPCGVSGGYAGTVVAVAQGRRFSLSAGTRSRGPLPAPDHRACVCRIAVVTKSRAHFNVCARQKLRCLRIFHRLKRQSLDELKFCLFRRQQRQRRFSTLEVTAQLDHLPGTCSLYIPPAAG